MIIEMKNRGISIKQIAEELNLDRKTISKWLKAEKLPAYQRTGKSTSKLDKYKEYVLKRMMEGCLNAMMILDEITEMGYTGKISILRKFMKPYRKHHKGTAPIRYETPPGKPA